MVWPRADTESDRAARRRAESKVTLLIPTKNRSDLLIRLLKYYRSIDFQGYICIGDSSDDGHLQATREAIQKLQGKLNIIYREYPGLNITRFMTNLAALVPTEYVATLMDDDFLVTRGLARCVQFLENQPEYVAAHGVAALFTLESDSAYGRLVGVSHYRLPVLEAESASQRLMDHLGNYSVPLFSVHRVESWLAMWRDTSLAADRWISEELLPACLSVIQGKVKELDCLYLVRQIHNRRAFHLDIWDQLTSPTWFRSHGIFRECLAEALSRQEGVAVEEAREVVKKAFWSFLAQGIMRKWQARYSKDRLGLHSRLRKVGRRFPGLRNAWHMTRSFLPGENNEMSLPALLRPSSPYHADFMPIYRAIQEFTPTG